MGQAGGPQYEVYATHGKGVFSSVLRARDLARRDPATGEVPEVAIKARSSGAAPWGGGAVAWRGRA